MLNLKQIIQDRAKSSPMWRGVESGLVVEYANNAVAEIISPEAIKTAKCVYFKNDILAFACLSSVVAQEIRLNENKIIAAVNQKIGRNAVKKIRYLA